ncbi:hypothetical protein JZ751_025380 [Albula glossodonta]|uniref:Uncharacterized protein n=1 Tax=Albula glossodonta TaxID=121402 RepID=A0A8T2NID0_9TELE|nr:hypothetical protein JZ751_025380 [Albula glossodonta]
MASPVTTGARGEYKTHEGKKIRRRERPCIFSMTAVNMAVNCSHSVPAEDCLEIWGCGQVSLPAFDWRNVVTFAGTQFPQPRQRRDRGDLGERQKGSWEKAGEREGPRLTHLGSHASLVPLRYGART